jgi:hypothetical protein
MNDAETALFTAVRAFVLARRDYAAKAAHAKAHIYSEHAAGRAHLALAALQRAEDTLLAAYDATQADRVPALLEAIERTAHR